MGKKNKKIATSGIHIMSNNTFRGETFVITLLTDESQIYYIPAAGTSLSFVSVSIDLPPGTYIVKVKGKDKEQLVTVMENGYVNIDWLDEWL